MWRLITTMVMPAMALLAIFPTPQTVNCSRDGFNMYKDLLLRGKGDGVDDASDQLIPEDVPTIPKLYFYRTPILAPHHDGLSDYMFARETLDGPLESVEADGSSKGSVLRDRFPLPRTIVKRDVGRRYTYTGSNPKTSNNEEAVMNKRGPGSILTWALSAKRPLLQSDMRQ